MAHVTLRMADEEIAALPVGVDRSTAIRTLVAKGLAVDSGEPDPAVAALEDLGIGRLDAAAFVKRHAGAIRALFLAETDEPRSTAVDSARGKIRALEAPMVEWGRVLDQAAGRARLRAEQDAERERVRAATAAAELRRLEREIGADPAKVLAEAEQRARDEALRQRRERLAAEARELRSTLPSDDVDALAEDGEAQREADDAARRAETDKIRLQITETEAAKRRREEKRADLNRRKAP